MENNKIKKIIISLLVIASVTLVIGSGFHYTYEIWPGVFIGSFEFNGSVDFTNATVTGLGEVGSGVPLGTVAAFNLSSCPSGWAEFTNAKGRVIVGLDSSQTEFDTLGETGGAKNHTLTEAEMPSHRHYGESRRNLLYSGGGGRANDAPLTAAYAGTGYIWYTAYSGGSGGENGVSASTNSPHNNLQPYYVAIYCIKTGTGSVDNSKLGSSGNNVYLNSTSDRFGIGTTSPSVSFEVACPSGFTNVKTGNNQLGCMQTTEEGTGTWEVAIDDCFDTYGGRLPSSGEWYIAMNNYALTNEIDDWEWNNDYGPTANTHTVSGSSGITNQNHDADSTTYAYRCWIPR